MSSYGERKSAADAGPLARPTDIEQIQLGEEKKTNPSGEKRKTEINIYVYIFFSCAHQLMYRKCGSVTEDTLDLVDVISPVKSRGEMINTVWCWSTCGERKKSCPGMQYCLSAYAQGREQHAEAGCRPFASWSGSCVRDMCAPLTHTHAKCPHVSAVSSKDLPL